MLGQAWVLRIIINVYALHTSETYIFVMTTWNVCRDDVVSVTLICIELCDSIEKLRNKKKSPHFTWVAIWYLSALQFVKVCHFQMAWVDISCSFSFVNTKIARKITDNYTINKLKIIDNEAFVTDLRLCWLHMTMMGDDDKANNHGYTHRNANQKLALVFVAQVFETKLTKSFFSFCLSTSSSLCYRMCNHQKLCGQTIVRVRWDLVSVRFGRCYFLSASLFHWIIPIMIAERVQTRNLGIRRWKNKKERWFHVYAKVRLEIGDFEWLIVR